MAKTKVDGSEKTPIKQKSRNATIEFDELKAFFGEPLVIDLEGVEGVVTVTQPAMIDIVRIGQARFYATLNVFTTNTTACRLMLWESGIDWNEISDFQLFCMMTSGIDPEVSAMLFGDLDFSKFEMFTKQKDDAEEIVLYNKEQQIEIDERVYQHFCQYLRTVFNINPEEKITNDKTMKQWFINKDKRERANAAFKQEKESSIVPIISACINHPGFKYNLEELKNVKVYQFYDAVRRLQIYEQSTALLKGMYSGFVDSSHIDPDAYNFMK